jgi:hypothetical protein
MSNGWSMLDSASLLVFVLDPLRVFAETIVKRPAASALHRPVYAI